VLLELDSDQNSGNIKKDTMKYTDRMDDMPRMRHLPENATQGITMATGTGMFLYDANGRGHYM
jgi:hypothetical protein